MAYLRTAARCLVFSATREELLALGPRHALIGLGLALLAGVGRNWDSEGLPWLRHAGLGSVAYAIVLSAILFVAFAPLRPEALGFSRLVAFVGITSPPAFLYAIPVERFLEPESAATANVVLLFVVAIWRVALLAWFAGRLTRLPWVARIAGIGFPLIAVSGCFGLIAISASIARSMGGWRAESGAAVFAEQTMVYVGLAAIYAALPWLAFWSVMVVLRNRSARPGP